MKTHTNTQGSAWLAVLVIIAVVVAALLLSGNISVMDDDSIQGRVDQINHEENYLILSHIKVLSVAEDGSAEIEETNYVVIWDDEAVIEPHHPSLLDSGEMIRVTPTEKLDENQTMFIAGSLEVTRGRDPVPEEADNFEIEEDSGTPATTSTTTTSN